MLPGIEMAACTDLAVPAEVMHHVAKVESSFNPYAIGVVGGRLARQPRSLGEALSTTRMLEREGYNFSLGIAQVNRYNLARHGLSNYERAFDVCPNLQAGARILAECYGRSGQDWGKAFSCYYSGNFTTGFRHGYVQKVVTSWRNAAGAGSVATAIPVIRTRPAAPNGTASPGPVRVEMKPLPTAAGLVLRRIEEAALSRAGVIPAGYPPMQQAPAMTGVPGAQPQQMLQAPMNPQAAAPVVPADDAPVVVQPMGARTASRPASNAAATLPPDGAAPAQMQHQAAPAAAAPQRDAAFVF